MKEEYRNNGTVLVRSEDPKPTAVVDVQLRTVASDKWMVASNLGDSSLMLTIVDNDDNEITGLVVYREAFEAFVAAIAEAKETQRLRWIK